jgi:hypothetical protein
MQEFQESNTVHNMEKYEGEGVFSFIWDLITYVCSYLSGGLASPQRCNRNFFFSRGEKPDKC